MRFAVIASMLVLCAPATRGELAQTTTVAETTSFAFHSDPWINLHHFLYQWSREEFDLGDVQRPVQVVERSSLAELSDGERETWLQALRFYRATVAARGHFDDEMLDLKSALVALGGDLAASPPDSIKGIAATLGGAMGVYQKRWWPRHDRANRSWSAAVVPLLRRHEVRFARTTMRIYGPKWPDARFRVDVAAYANTRAGYTTREGHIVIYSTDSGNQDLYGLETVFHEVQHAAAVSGTMTADLAGAFKRTGTELPPNLWHALIFATAGAFTQSVAEEERLAPHVPYWIKQGFEKREGWKQLISPIGEHWVPVVRGGTSKDEGFAALARALKGQ